MQYKILVWFRVMVYYNTYLETGILQQLKLLQVQG